MKWQTNSPVITTIGFAGLILLAACGTTGPEADTGSLQATITGNIDAEYAGSGEFSTGTRLSGAGVFNLRSEGQGMSGPARFDIKHVGSKRPRRGTHSITLLGRDRADPDEHGTGVIYVEAGDGERHYVAKSGSLEITDSSDKRVAGTFTITGFLYCQRAADVPPRQRKSCPVATRVDPDAPTIEVTGSFVAVPDTTRFSTD